MIINPLNSSFFSQSLCKDRNIFFIFGNELGLIDSCYLKLIKLINIKLKDPFSTKILDEKHFSEDNFLLNDELNSIGIFNENRSMILDLRKCDNKNKVSNILTKIDFENLRDVNLIIVSYDFKKSDTLTNILNGLKNTILFSCYEEDSKGIEKRVKKFFDANGIILSSEELNFLTYKFSKNYKINENIFQKIKLLSNYKDLSFDKLVDLIDDNNDQNIFEIANIILNGRYTEAVLKLSNLQKSGISSIPIIRSIVYKIKLLNKCFELKKIGFSYEDIVNRKELNIFYKDKQNIIKMMKKWNLPKLKLCFSYMYNLEIRCKSFKENEFQFLNKALLYIYFQLKN